MKAYKIDDFFQERLNQLLARLLRVDGDHLLDEWHWWYLKHLSKFTDRSNLNFNGVKIFQNIYDNTNASGK